MRLFVDHVRQCVTPMTFCCPMPGYDTTASTMCYIIQDLQRNPEVMDAVRKEQHQVCEKKVGLILPSKVHEAVAAAEHFDTHLCKAVSGIALHLCPSGVNIMQH